ncbi:MAG: hypothetical protein ACYTDT_06775 [Planctomycetota bacterium]|jgi:hypothetical protein
MHRKPIKKSLASLSIPEHKKRRGAYVVKMALRKVVSRQTPQALKTAATMSLLMPVLQMIILVPILNVEIWILLLGAEGLLIGWLAAAQLGSPEPESRLVGFGVAVLNTLALSIVGGFLGSQVFWVTSVMSILPVIVLVLSRTGEHTVARAWLVFKLSWVVMILLAAGARASMEVSSTDIDASVKSWTLDVSFVALQVRGSNGTERALLRLRQAQTAFDDGRYDEAFEFANDGLQDKRGASRGVPTSDLANGLLNSLLRMKAQAFYNGRWNKSDAVHTPIKHGPLPDEELDGENVSIRWGW